MRHAASVAYRYQAYRNREKKERDTEEGISMRTFIARFLSVSLAAAVCAAAFAASPAGASATAAKAAPSNDVIAAKVPMKVTGFDPAVAREYGHPAAAPGNRVNGNCGYSYYYLAKRTAKTWTFWTGFYSSKGAAVDYSWTTQVWGPAKYHTTGHLWRGGNRTRLRLPSRWPVG
jgi:hypothetical protein